MVNKIRILLRLIGCIILVTLLTFYFINPNQIFRLKLKEHNLVTADKQETEHIISYGVDAEEAEKIYKNLQIFFHAFYVNKKVKIYVAKPKWGNGIGYNSEVLYAGIYRHNRFGPDVIIYNGNPATLLHELTHFFFANAQKNHVNEALARFVPRYKKLAIKYRILKIAYTQVLEENGKATEKTTKTE